jgi:hypothetical protein
VKSSGTNAAESGASDRENFCVNGKSGPCSQTEVKQVAMTPQKTSLSRATTPQKTSLSRLTSCEIVSANPASATYVEELELMADLYSRCITGRSMTCAESLTVQPVLVKCCSLLP